MRKEIHKFDRKEGKDRKKSSKNRRECAHHGECCDDHLGSSDSRGKKRRKSVSKSSRPTKRYHSEDEISSSSGISSEDERHRRKQRKDLQKDHRQDRHLKKEEKRERRKKDKVKRRHSRHNKEPVVKDRRQKGAIPSSGSDDESSENDLPSSTEVVSSILLKFPDVASDLEKLLEMIDDGQAVDVSGLSNNHLAACLKELFGSLQLHQTSNGLFLLPEGANKTMDIVGDTIRSHVQTGNEKLGGEGESMDAKKDDGEGFHRVEAGGETPLNQNPYGPSEPRRRVIGPAMPSADMLAAAAKLTEAGSALREAEEELEIEPMIGPPPPAAVLEAESANEAERFEEVTRMLGPDVGNAYELLGLRPGAAPEMMKKRYWKLSLLVHPDKCAHPQAHQAFTALNQAFKDLQDPTKRAIIDGKIEEKEAREEFEAEMKAKREAAQWRKLRGESLPGDDLLLETPKAPTRDEWMTSLPPERQAGRPSMQSTFFSKSEKSGRGDTSIWTDTPLEKAQKAKMQYLEAYKQAALTSAQDDDSCIRKEHSSQTAEMLDHFEDKRRSISLVKKHQLEHSKKSKETKSRKQEQEQTPEWSGSHPWKPWDREKDLNSGRQAVKFDGSSMAQGLSSRFSSSNKERSFL